MPAPVITVILVSLYTYKMMSILKGICKSLWFKVSLVIVSPFLLYGFLLTVLFTGHSIQMYHLRHLDHVRILSASREAIANRNSYPCIPQSPDDIEHNLRKLLFPITTNFPAAIRELNPHAVYMYEDRVQIYLPCVPFTRVSLVGFKVGAKQDGTFQFIDGLWFQH